MADEREEQGKEENIPKKSKGRMLLFMITGALLVFAGAGGYFAYTKFMNKPPAEISSEEQQPKDQKLSLSMGEVFPLEPFVVNLADPKGKRYLKLKIELELDSPKMVEIVTRATPKLRDAVIIMLTSLSFEEVMTPEGKIRIRDELQNRFNQILRPYKVKHVYFTEFVVQ